MTAQGAGVASRVVAWPNGDVIAMEIDDTRAHPEAITIDLRMLRYQSQYTPGQTASLTKNHAVVFRTGAHTATSLLGVQDGRITLTQQFREDDFYDSSAVAIAVVGRASRARYANASTVKLSAAAGQGRFTILIGSAASRTPSENTAALALKRVAAAEAKGFDALRSETAAWWQTFWSRGGVYLHSASGQADMIEANYNFFLYLMGSSSRGAFPTRFGGGLWQTDGDMSRWGSQYWWANTSAYYSNLMPANRIELMDPMFDLYTGMLDAAARAAREQWGAAGIWIPETTFFNGPEPLPPDIAGELQDLVLARKPFDQRSPRFDWFAENKNRHNSRWNYRADGTWQEGHYVFKPKGTGIFGHTSHILGVAARIGNLAWQRYQFTSDIAWLRDRAYPFIKGAAEFYRSFPNLQKDASGVYHINHTNSGESAWDSRDAPYEVSCMHMIFPLAARAASVLGVDADLRAQWQEIESHLVAGPARARCGTGSEIADDRPYGAFVYNGPGAIEPIGPEPDLKRRFLGFTRLGSFIDADGIGGAQIFRNHLRLREGPGAIDAEHIAGLASGIHSTLLNSHPESPGDDKAVDMFSAWPKDWDAAFTLAARGGFVISAAQLAGQVPLVEIVSTRGGPLRLTQPWGNRGVTVYRSGRKAEDLQGTVLSIPTSPGETVVLVPRGERPKPVTVL
jgi:Glycosyl hydrolase family 95 catalytic domain